MTQREERIRERARQLWEADGKPEHQDERFWRQAEQEIDGAEPPIRRDDPAGPPVGTPRR